MTQVTVATAGATEVEHAAAQTFSQRRKQKHVTGATFSLYTVCGASGDLPSLLCALHACI